MVRFFALALSELAAIVFAIYLAIFLFYNPSYNPPIETAMRSAFIFCGICAAYWWVQSGSLAVSGVETTLGMATNILISFLPVFVVGIALIDYWRGSLPLSLYKQYSAHFALAVSLLDITCNTMIMTRLSRRYVGIS